MTWQDELRKLDEELAAGRLTADDYRVRRDQVLSSAVASGAPAPNPESAEATQMMPPITGAPQPGGDDSGEKTQIVPGNTMPTSERTQAIQPEQGGWQAARPAGDGDRTQVVPGMPPQQQQRPGMAPPPPPGYQQNPQAPLWNTQQPQAPSPWDGPTFPPLAHGTEDWVKQGPEESSSGRKIAVIIGIVVLVAALGVGGYFAFFNKNNNEAGGQNPPPTTATSQQPPPVTTTTRPKDDLEIAPLQSSTERADLTSFDQVVANKMLTGEENAAYKKAGADKCRAVEATLPGDVHVLILTVEAKDAKKAKAAVTSLAKLQARYGMTKYAGTSPSGVKVNQIDKKGGNPALVRGHYTHKNTIVRVQVVGPTLAATSAAFDQVISAQLGALAADV